jgi:hypothetical protein
LGSHKIQVKGLSKFSERVTVALGVVVATPEVVFANNSGRLSLAQSELLIQPTVKSVSAMSDGSAANIIVFLMVLLMLVSALVTAQPLGRRRSASLIEMVMTMTPWNAANPAIRLATLGTGVLLGATAAFSSGFTVVAPAAWLTIAWICLGVLDMAAGGVTGLTFAVLVTTSGGVGSLWDLRLLVVMMSLGIAPSLLALALRRRIGNPVLSLVVSAAMHAIVSTTLVLSLEALSGMYFDVHDSLNVMAAFVVLTVVIRHRLSARFASDTESPDVLAPRTRLFAAMVVGVVFLTPATRSNWSVGAWILLCIFSVFGLPALRNRISIRPMHLVLGVATVSVLIVSAGLVESSKDVVEYAESRQNAIEIEAVRSVVGANGLVDGFPADVRAVLTTDGAIMLTASGTDTVVSIVSLDGDGAPIPLGLQDQLQIVREGSIRVRVTGSGAGLSVTAWLFSEPILFGNALSDDAGEVDAVLRVSNAVPDGFHTVQLRLTDVAGRSVSMSLPVTVAVSFVNVNA